jgi:hypothetical protein
MIFFFGGWVSAKLFYIPQYVVWVGSWLNKSLNQWIMFWFAVDLTGASANALIFVEAKIYTNSTGLGLNFHKCSPAHWAGSGFDVSRRLLNVSPAVNISL